MNYKTIIAPIVATICLGIGTFTGHHFGNDVQGEITDIGTVIVGCGVSIYGIIKNHKK